MSPSPVPHRSPPGQAEIEAWLGRIYPQAVAHARPRDLLSQYCRSLAEHLGAALVTLARADDGGTLTMLAQSDEGLLWAELHRVPERWDECLAGNAAAGSALRGDQPVVMQAGDERLLVWRNALERERILCVLACPFSASGLRHVVQVYSAGPLAAAAADLGPAVVALARLVTDLQRLQREHVLASALESAGNAAFITDLEGTIVWSNQAFARLSGYTTEETLGRNPRFLSSGQQSVRYYRELWATIRSGKVWSGETVDRDREGRSYAVQQTVSPVATGTRVTHYLSIHEDITAARRARQDLERILGTDPATGLLTPASFEMAGEHALLDAAHEHPFLLALLSSPSLRTSPLREPSPGPAVATLGARLRAALPTSALVCSPRRGEFLVLLADEQEGSAAAVLAQAVAALGEAGDSGGLPDLVVGSAAFPAEATSLTDLRLLAERRLANQPLPRADRRVPH